MSKLEDEIAAARAKMQTYNEAATCSACGFGTIATTHHAKNERRWDDLMERLLNLATSFVPFDLLERTCARCGKRWAELPLSAAPRVEVSVGP